MNVSLKAIYRIMGLCVFAGMIIYANHISSRASAESNRMLTNGIYVKGRAIDIKLSTNHAFGVILLNVDTSNVKQFTDTLNGGVYPYKIKGRIAELYTRIPDGIRKGDTIIIASNRQTVTYHKTGEALSDESFIWIINDPIDLNFIKTNSSLVN